MTPRFPTLKSISLIALLLAFLAACEMAPPPPVATNTLAVTVVGAGSVDVDPPGITVTPGTRTTVFAAGTEVTLTPEAAEGHTFTGWTGDCEGTNECVLTMDEHRTATATFAPDVEEDFTLSVTVEGDGEGTVTTVPEGIFVTEGTEAAEFAAGTEVTLTATAAEGSTFTGWGGDCAAAGTDPCLVTMDADRDVTATFVMGEPELHTLTVTVTGDGTGTVTSAPAGISAAVGETDTAEFAEGTQVTLTASPAVGSRLASWGEACEGAAATCVVTMDADTTVTAEFVPAVGEEVTEQFVIATGTDDAQEFLDDLASPNWPAGSVHATSSDLDLTWDTQFLADNIVGLRYQNVTIPEGAVIVSATITFTREAVGAGSVTLTFQGQAIDDAPTFASDGAGVPSFDISTRDRTDASVDWASTTAWGTTATTPDLANVVQAIVDRDGWASGNALAFIISSDDSDAANYRRAQSYEGGTPPVLSVTYIVFED